MLEDLDLPPLELRRKTQRIQLLNKIQENQIPALPPDSFLTSASPTKRKIREPKKLEDYIVTNILDRQIVKNSRGYTIPPVNSDQLKYSFFINTPRQWNGLTDNDISTVLASAASTAQEQPGPAAQIE